MITRILVVGKRFALGMDSHLLEVSVSCYGEPLSQLFHTIFPLTILGQPPARREDSAALAVGRAIG